MINAETSVVASGGNLWQKIRDRWRARRAERETKTHQVATWRDEGRRGDGEHELAAEGICQGRQQEQGREATQRRPQDALRALSASEGSQKEQLRPYSELAATKGKGHGLGPPGIAAFTGSYKHCRREAAQCERPTRQEWQTSSKYGTIWSRRGLSIWYLIASWPKCTTQL